MTLRTPILAAALFTSVAALGLSHATAHAAPATANPGATPPGTGHHPPENRNNRSGSTTDPGPISYSPPTKNGRINPPPAAVQPPTPPGPWPDPPNTGYADQFGNSGIVPKVHAHN